MPLNPPQAYRKTAFTHRRGTRAAQPNFADVLTGTLYYVTDEDVIERSTGAAWEQYSVKPTRNALATTITAGITLANNTASTAIATKQISPALIFSGTSWDANDSVSRTTRIAIYNKPATDNSPFPGLYFATDPASGTFTDKMLFGSADGDLGATNWRLGTDVNIIFSRSGRGISFVASPLTSAIDSNFFISGDVSGGLNRIKFNAVPGFVFIEANNAAATPGVTPSMDFRNFDGSTAVPIVGIQHRATKGGGPSAGFGTRQQYQADSTTTTNQNQGTFDMVWSDPTHATRSADFVINLVHNAAAQAEKFRFRSRGLLDVVAGYINWVGQKRVTAQFDKTNDAALANITGLSVDVEAGKSYYFEAHLFVDADVTGGHKYAIAGTATATSIKYQVNSLDNILNVFVITSRQVALGGAVGQAGAATIETIIKGQIVVNAAGTLTVQFAQNVATPATTSSVLTNSYFEVQEIA